MAFTKELNGTLFKNDRKEKPNQPDYTGNCMIEGVTYRISSWIKDGANGKFMSLAFSVPQDRPPAKPAAKPAPANDDIPFNQRGRSHAE